MYSDISPFIDGKWGKAAAGRVLPVVNPATDDEIGTVAHADKSDLDRALEAAERGFRTWCKLSSPSPPAARSSSSRRRRPPLRRPS